MSKSFSAIEIVATASKHFVDICDVPVLSPLKPIGGIVLTICEHAAAVKGNKEAVIMLAEQVNNVIRVLANRTRDLGGDMPGGYLSDIESLQNVLLKIATTLQRLRQRNRLVRLFAPKADASQIEGLFLELNNAMQLFGLSTHIEVRQALQTARALASREGVFPSSQLQCPVIDPIALRVHDELDATDHYSIQVGTYHNQAVVAKKYYTSKERLFVEDLKKRLDQIHPGIACVIGSSKNAKLILLSAEDLIFPKQDMVEIESIKRLWQEHRVGPPVPLADSQGQDVERTLSQRASAPLRIDDQSFMKMQPISPEVLTVKESEEILRQLISVVRFLEKMDIRVAWWQFKPSWTGLRQSKQIVLIDWTEKTGSDGDIEFEPQYAVHILGLGFSDTAPHTFKEAGRLLSWVSQSHSSPPQTEERSVVRVRWSPWQGQL